MSVANNGNPIGIFPFFACVCARASFLATALSGDYLKNELSWLIGFVWMQWPERVVYGAWGKHYTPSVAVLQSSIREKASNARLLARQAR